MERITKDWLFGDHSEEEIYKWITHLKYFLFFRAVGGHANDGDYLELRIDFTDLNDQNAFLRTLNLHKMLFEPTRIQLPEPFSKLHCTLGSKGVCVTVVGICGNPYKIGEPEFNLCLQFERLIEQGGLESKINYHEKTRGTCITRENYLDYFKSDHC